MKLAYLVSTILIHCLMGLGLMYFRLSEISDDFKIISRPVSWSWSYCDIWFLSAIMNAE